MAKPKGLKLKDFFGGNRRKAHLLRWEHLVNAAGEPRIKLTLKLPMLNQAAVGLHGAISDQFDLMAKQDSKIQSAKLDVYWEGMTIEVFTTDTVKRRAAMSTGATMMKFSLQSEGDEEKKTVDLHCVVYLPANEQWRDWAWIHRGADFWLAAEYSQSEIEFADDTEDDADEPDEDEAPAPVSAKPRLPKSGPKDLAAYHQKQNGKEAAVTQ